MHIWPSVSIREKFKYAYLNKLEWNFQRMKREKEKGKGKQKQKQSSLNDKLLENQKDSQDAGASKQEENSGGIMAFCHDFLMILSCCYCCICCGACVEEK